jgi:hypothetical protein
MPTGNSSSSTKTEIFLSRKLSPDGVQVLSKTALLERNSWTAPSLAGKTLYVRDRRSILALELP